MDVQKSIQCLSPINGSVYLERPLLSFEDAKKQAMQAHAAQSDWANRSLKERISLVESAVEIMGKHSESGEMATELAHQMGRPVRYGGEFGGFKERADAMCKIADAALSPIIVEQSAAFTRKIERTPRGVVFVIAPWNYPYMTAINTIAPALIAGNCVVLKHASQTLLVGERIAQAFHSAGVPEDVLQNIVVSHDTTEKLIQQRLFNFINFTGSVNGGKAMEVAAAGTFTPVSTELGGKDPGYVRADANLDAAVDTLIDGAMFNSGQCCCGIERIYVHHTLYQQFVDKAVAIVDNYKLGNPLDQETTLGPMATPRTANEVRTQIDEALAAGAKRITKLHSEDDGAAYLSPALLTNVDHSMRLMKDENFGPVVGIMSVESDEQAIELMNDSVFGLTVSIWSADESAVQTIGEQLDTGTVFMNRCDYLDPELCWTGCKDTGNGAGLSIIAFHNLTKPKSFHLKKA